MNTNPLSFLRLAGGGGRLVPAILGTASLAGYVIAVLGLGATGRREDVVAFLGLFAGLFVLYALAWLRFRQSGENGGRWEVRHVLGWALLFRLALVPAGLPPSSWLEGLAADLRSEAVTYRTFLLYDNDVWRYLWDGHAAAAGFDPYADSPLRLAELAEEGDTRAVAAFDAEPWTDVYDNVYYQGLTTIYPPLAQGLFRLLHAVRPASVAAWKLVLALIDFGTCLLLAGVLKQLGRRPAEVVIYAWNPLAVKEIAGSGHLDALMIFCLVGAVYALLRGYRRTALAAFGLAILAKLTPVLLAGFFLRRTRWRDWPVVALVLAAGYAPFLGSLPAMVDGFRAFASQWMFNPGPWKLLLWTAQQAGLEGRGLPDAVAGIVTLGLVALTLWRDDGTPRSLVSGIFVVLGGFLVFGATVMPWYLLWVLPFAACRRSVAWPALTALSLLSYLIYIDQVEHAWWLWTEYLAFFALLAWELRFKARRTAWW